MRLVYTDGTDGDFLALCRKIGYETIPNYGPYQKMPDSVCMKKKL